MRLPTTALMSGVLILSLLSGPSSAQESPPHRSLTFTANSDAERLPTLLGVTLHPADESEPRVGDHRNDGAHGFHGLAAGHYAARLYYRDGFQQVAVSLTGDLYHRDIVVDPNDHEAWPLQPHPSLFLTVLLDGRPVPDRLVHYTLRTHGAGTTTGAQSTNPRGELLLDSLPSIPRATDIGLAIAGADPIELRVQRSGAPLWASFSTHIETLTLRDRERRPIPSAWLSDSQSPYQSQSDRQGQVDLPPKVVHPRVRYQRWSNGEMTTVQAPAERKGADLVVPTLGARAHVIEVEATEPRGYQCFVHVNGNRVASLALLGGCGYFADLPLPAQRPVTFVALPISLDGSPTVPLCATFEPPFDDRFTLTPEPPRWISLSFDESAGPPRATPTQIWTNGSRATEWEHADHYADPSSPRSIRVLAVPGKHYRIAHAGRIADYTVPAHPTSTDLIHPQPVAFQPATSLHATIGTQERLIEFNTLRLEARSTERSWRLLVPKTDAIELTVDATTSFPVELYLVGPFGELHLGRWDHETHEPSFDLPEDTQCLTVRLRP